MGFFVFALLAIVAVSAGPTEKPFRNLSSPWLVPDLGGSNNTEHNCEPLKMFLKYCNTCVCAADGKSATCTNEECTEGVFAENGALRAYDPNVKHYCKPDKHYMVNCNHCWCDFNGITSLCTADSCDETTCEPNKVTRKGCYECTCNADGDVSICYGKFCETPFD